MLLQTNSYVVPRDKRQEHSRLLRKFRQTLARLGCDHFEVYEQVGSNWSTGETTGRFVQIMRFRDRKHQQAVQGAERSDPAAQALIAEFCELINFPYQQQQGLFAVGFYTSALPIASARPRHVVEPAGGPDDVEQAAEEEELVVESHGASADAPAGVAEDDSSLGDLGGDVEQSDLAEQPPSEEEGFAEELEVESEADESRDDPADLSEGDFEELGEEQPNDRQRPA